MNKCTLLGRTTKDPDISFTPDGLCVARFSLAVTRRYKKDEADFINCVCFGKLAEIFQKFVKKGDKICVAGRIQAGSYNNREGKKVYTTDIVVEDLDMCGSKAAEAPKPQEPADPEPPKEVSDGFMKLPPGIEEEMPFL